MTREEQIDDAADAFARRKILAGDLNYIKEESFRQGAEWADANRWIKIEDGMPETPNLCIVLLDDGGFEFDHFAARGHDGRHSFSNKNITHWQYVTEP